MPVSPSIPFIIQLAAQEAAAAGFSCVEPEHVFMALLKFTELPVDGVVGAIPEAELFVKTFGVA